MQLIFVYNANSGKVNTFLDAIHKIVSPKTYDCNLCHITFGVFSENKTWKQFRENSGIDMKFYHRDEFQKKFKSKWLDNYSFPTILLENNNELIIFMSSEDLNSIESVPDLMDEITNRLAPH